MGCYETLDRCWLYCSYSTSDGRVPSIIQQDLEISSEGGQGVSSPSLRPLNSYNGKFTGSSAPVRYSNYRLRFPPYSFMAISSFFSFIFESLSSVSESWALSLTISASKVSMILSWGVAMGIKIAWYCHAVEVYFQTSDSANLHQKYYRIRVYK